MYSFLLATKWSFLSCLFYCRICFVVSNLAIYCIFIMISQKQIRRPTCTDRFIRSSHDIARPIAQDTIPELHEYDNDDNGNGNEIIDFINIAMEQHYAKNYRKLLKSVFTNLNNNQLKFPAYWAAESRTKPLLSDVPRRSIQFCFKYKCLGKMFTTWGRNGVASSIKTKIFITNPSINRITRISFFAKTPNITCLKWNKTGNLLAMGNEDAGFPYVLVWNIEKMLFTGSCACKVHTTCIPKAIDWTDSDQLIIGCSLGCLAFWDNFTKLSYFSYGSCIKTIVSNRKYVATIRTDQKVWIQMIPKLDFVCNITLETKKMEPKKLNIQEKISKSPTAITWHPSNANLLAIAHEKNIFIWNVVAQTKIAHTSVEGAILDITFNPLSAELVFSTYKKHKNGNSYSYLHVMKNTFEIVDQVRCSHDKILNLMWDSTGTKLGTFEKNMVLNIWHFFGESTSCEKKFLDQRENVSLTGLLHLINN